MKRVNFGIAWCAVLVYGLVGMAASQCTHAQAWVATGESITVLGETFAATGEAMDSALATGAITPETHAKWLEFAKRFGKIYGPAFDLWRSSEVTLDRKSAAAAGSVIADLALELAGWQTTALESTHE